MASEVFLKLLYNAYRTAIPALYQVRVNSSGNPCGKDWIPPYQVRGKLIKSGMTTL